jgi:hypothetical protein
MRIPHPELSRRARFLKFALGISYGAVVVFAFALPFWIALVGAPSAAGGTICFLQLAAVALLIFGIMYLLMLGKLGQRFAEQGRIAEAAWTSIDGRESAAMPIGAVPPPAPRRTS